MRRRELLKGAVLLPSLARANASSAGEQHSDLNPGWISKERLDQGPFDIEQDQGWQTVLFTTPSERHLRNPGLGLVGYAWEESGPSLAARTGRESLEQHVEKNLKLTLRRCSVHPVRLAERAIPSGSS